MKIDCSRFSLLFTLTLSIPFLSGCNHGISTSELNQIDTLLGDLAIVPQPLNCFPDYKPWADNPLSGFGKGAGEGALTAAASGNPGQGDFAVFAALLLMASGAVVGGSIGAFQAVPEEVSSEIEESLRFVSQGNINETIALEVYTNSIQTRPDLNPCIMKRHLSSGEKTEEPKDSFYDYLRQTGKETVLTIDALELTFEGGKGSKPSVALHLKVHTQLVSLEDERFFYRKEYDYLSKEYPWRSWSENQSTLLVNELAAAYHELASRIYAEQIEMPAHSIPFKSGLFSPSVEVSGNACFLQPLYPKVKLKNPIELLTERDGLYIEAAEVDSLQPTLKWEGFPRPRDITSANAEIVEKITDVAYELRIWKKDGNGRLLVYERDMLTVPEHKIENELEPETNYFWSFRAKYKVGTKQKDTLWAFYNYMPDVPSGSCYCDIADISNRTLFRFKTPVEE